MHTKIKFDYSNESYWVVLSCGTFYYAVKGVSNFWVCKWSPKVSVRADVSYFLCFTPKANEIGDVCTQAILRCNRFKRKLLCNIFLWCGTRWFELFGLWVTINLKCDHSNGSYCSWEYALPVLLCCSFFFSNFPQVEVKGVSQVTMTSFGVKEKKRNG